MRKKIKGPKVLLLDIETSPILAYVWRLYDENIRVNQIKEDWSIIAWAAKWLHDPASKIIYKDQRNAKDLNDDKKILKPLWKLLDEADIIVTQNGKRFDQKKINTRFLLNGMKPPSSYKHIDTREIAKKKFGFTSNSLEYLSDNLAAKYKKLTKRKFAGFDLWRECLSRNREAWKEMERYNKQDVLALEEVYKKLAPWDNSINFALYTDDNEMLCSCGSTKFRKNGHTYTSVGKFQRYECSKCGAESKNARNEFSKAKRQSLARKVT